MTWQKNDIQPSPYLVITSDDVRLTKYEDVEPLYELISVAYDSGDYRPLEIHFIRLLYIRVDALLALVMVTQLWYEKTHQLTQLASMNIQIHRYFERMNVFGPAITWIKSLDVIDSADLLDRVDESVRLLEICPLSGKEQDNAYDVSRLQNRLRSILDASTYYVQPGMIQAVSNIFSEIGSNVPHSTQNGWSVVQRIDDKKNVATTRSFVVIAVADLGIGIEASLKKQDKIASEIHAFTKESEYLRYALRLGITSRRGAGGMGLRKVEDIVQQWSGSLTLRSHRAYLHILFDGSERNPTITVRDDLTYIDGTHVVIVVNV